MNLAALKPGDRVLVAAVIEQVAEPNGIAARVAIEGSRPPFTRMIVEMLPDDVVAMDERPVVTPPDPLKSGDRVRDERGEEYEVTGDPRETDDGKVEVALWNGRVGFTSDRPENLERVKP